MYLHNSNMEGGYYLLGDCCNFSQQPLNLESKAPDAT